MLNCFQPRILYTYLFPLIGNWIYNIYMISGEWCLNIISTEDMSILKISCNWKNVKKLSEHLKFKKYDIISLYF